MNIYIDNKSDTPIYDQIYTQIKGRIICGALQEDDPLPSIRGLAHDLRISVITTKRAYDELEREGFIYTVPGKGSFVSPMSAELVREQHIRTIEELIRKINDLAPLCGLGCEEIVEMVRFQMQRDFWLSDY